MTQMYTVYGKKNCVWCEKAVALLRLKNRPYTYMELNRDYDIEFLLVKNLTTVPQIWLDGEYVGGYTELEKSLQ